MLFPISKWVRYEYSVCTTAAYMSRHTIKPLANVHSMTMRSLALMVASTCIGAVGYSLLISPQARHEAASPLLPSLDAHDLINKSVVNDSQKHFIINFLPLRKYLEEIQSQYPQNTYIYFAYLNNSSWIGLSERGRFYAASTTKVPLAMTVLKAVEDKKLTLDQQYSLDELDLNSDFGTLYQKGPDATFSIRELLDIMLQQSDDTASVALLHALTKLGMASPLDDVYNSMGWEFNTIGAAPDYRDITLKTLSNMFISLYNASYVNIDNSQHILDDLTKTPFNDAIIAGLPRGIRVAHKIGIADQYKVYSDCGIVYAPNRNYLLCLAAQGLERDAADAFMTDVSAAVYHYVDSN